MSGLFLSRLMLSVVAGLQGIAPFAMDLNKTHARNPLWPGHARFHVVWQTFSSLLLAIPEVALVWWPGPGPRWRFYLAAALAAAPMLGFAGALAFRNFYQGTLHDANGMRPLQIRMGRGKLVLDGNVLAVVPGLIVLVVAVLLFAFGAPRSID